MIVALLQLDVFVSFPIRTDNPSRTAQSGRLEDFACPPESNPLDRSLQPLNTI
jgi:hypothetical protein